MELEWVSCSDDDRTASDSNEFAQDIRIYIQNRRRTRQRKRETAHQIRLLNPARIHTHTQKEANYIYHAKLFCFCRICALRKPIFFTFYEVLLVLLLLYCLIRLQVHSNVKLQQIKLVGVCVCVHCAGVSWFMGSIKSNRTR